MDAAAATYTLTLARLIELIQDPSTKGVYKDTLTGEIAEIGYTEGASRASGVSKPSLANYLQKWERYLDEPTWDIFPMPSPPTFIRLAALINRLEPALIDPLDPEKRPIRFPGAVVGELQVLGWQELMILHLRSAPPEDEVLPIAPVPAKAGYDPKEIERLKRLLDTQPRGYTLTGLIKDSLHREPVEGIEEWIEWAADKVPFTLSRGDKALLKRGIEVALSGKIPVDEFIPTIPVLALVLKDFGGNPFTGPEDFLDYCGLIQPNNEGT